MLLIYAFQICEWFKRIEAWEGAIVTIAAIAAVEFSLSRDLVSSSIVVLRSVLVAQSSSCRAQCRSKVPAIPVRSQILRSSLYAMSYVCLTLAIPALVKSSYTFQYLDQNPVLPLCFINHNHRAQSKTRERASISSSCPSSHHLLQRQLKSNRK